MPEVISLLSSTPPPPSYQPRRPSSIPSSSPNPPAAPATFTLPILSSDWDLPPSAYDSDKIADTDINGNPPKRPRLSDELSPFQPPSPKPKPARSHLPASRNPLFLFSDDILPSSDGPQPCEGLESDPIVFTSPAPAGLETRRPIVRGAELRNGPVRGVDTITIDDDDDDDDDDYDYDLGRENRSKNRAGAGNFTGNGGIGRGDVRDEIEGFSDEIGMPDLNELLGLGGTGNTRPGLSSRTASLLASLDQPRSGPGGGKGLLGWRGRVDKEEEVGEVDEVVQSRKMKALRRTMTKPTSADKEAKAREREANKAQREREKQLEKERKQKAKEEKAREKQLAADLAGVNKLKVDKKESTPEMIIDLAKDFEGTSVGNQAVEFMKRLKVEQNFFESEIPNVVKWRRKVTARYNDTLGYWEPCPFHICGEHHVLVLVTAQEFVNMVIDSSATTSDLDHHVRRLKSAYPDCAPIYLIEGLTTWMRKNKNSRNRAYQAEVRRQCSQSQTQGQPTTSRRKKTTTNKLEATPPVSDDTIEDALLSLQVTHSCLIHHTNAAPESAEWIKNFTEHISTVPYRRERMEGNDSAFCMDGGQVKPGENKSDTFVKMLQEVHRVTASMAYGITTQYPSAIDLVCGMRRHGPAMLEDVKKSANRNGGLTDSRVGPAASKRLYKVFMGLDPSATDI
ncbi:ERCC4 domain-containing protein [Aspergillus bertholletiae]|uniref:ERCC4 domain-containing protein n=1 Tax=Aspergillus bertholletiae TaxID=1226010 RepID=A0A5N7BGL0_9EURO|nr:ERCC4 domain-containing protein [Aspergillus bertholletiae]